MAVTLVRQIQLRDIGGLTRETITQTAHGFSTGEAIYYNGTQWALARADSVSTAEVLGIVESVKTNQFDVVYQGKIQGLTGLTPGAVYFLSSTVLGGLTTIVPGSDVVSKPLLVARSTTDAIVVNWRGLIGSGTGGSTGATAEVWTALVGDGANTSFTLTPGMDTSKVIVQLSEVSTGEVIGGPETITIGYNSDTQVKIDFLVAPSSNQYKVVIIGG